MGKSEFEKALKAALAEMVSEAWETEVELAVIATTSMAVKWSTSIPATRIHASPRLEGGTAEAAETWAASSYPNQRWSYSSHCNYNDYGQRPYQKPNKQRMASPQR